MTLLKQDFTDFKSSTSAVCVQLSETELSDIEELIQQMMEQFDSIESSDFAMFCEVMATRLPERLFVALRTVSSGDYPSTFLQVKGFEVDQASIGPSPEHWDQPWSHQPYLREEMFQALISSAVGGLFGWRTQENGRFLRHIIPIEAVAEEQLGGSSSVTLAWHTEEAFHPGRADYFTLMCYRNEEKAITNIASVEDLKLPTEVLNVLRQPRFIIEPDKSHTPSQNESANWTLNKRAFEQIFAMLENPQPVALIYGSESMPFMRVDQAFASALSGDAEAEAAIVAFHEALNTCRQELCMEPGDLILLDNLRVAHGRSVYAPNYGPNQRWMRRVNIMNGRRHFHELRDSKQLRVML